MIARILIAVVISLAVGGCGGSTPGVQSPAGSAGGGAGASPSASATEAGTATPPLPSPSATDARGVLHVVTEAGPTCPVQRAGQPACVRPLAATVEARPDNGGPATVIRTGDSGTADASLAAGVYTLHALSPGGDSQPPRPPADQSATVTAGGTVAVTMVWDTGIR